MVFWTRFSPSIGFAAHASAFTSMVTYKRREVLRLAENFIVYFNYSDTVIELGMGKGSKKKPMTKKERDERRKKRKEKRLKK